MKDLQNSKLPQPRNSSVLKFWALYGCVKETERYRIDWPLFGPQCVLARSCEMILKLILADVLRFRVTAAAL